MMFAKAFVINLPFKQDRLKVFQASVPACFGNVSVWPAVHGDSVRHPDHWKAGAGAWGCYRSHLQILEHCYQTGVESYIVFEDDAIFRTTFSELFESFTHELPPDWEMLYLGGQLLHSHQHPPKQLSDHVYIPYNVNRTHCFAVHKRGYERLYKHLNAPFFGVEHIDHHLGRLHESGSLKVYCPARWLVGQDGGASNISGKHNAATFFIDPEREAADAQSLPQRSIPAVFLEASTNVAIELERRGWHRGKWQSEQRLDRGVCNALTSGDVSGGLTSWYKAVMPEAVREGLKCVCLHHPHLSWDCVRTLACATFIHIKTDSADDAEDQLSAVLEPIPNDPPAPVVKNMIYHIWPKRGNGVWQWNVKQLLRRISQFDGVRSVGVVTDRESATLDDVKQAFGNERIDNWIQFPNDGSRGESTTFTALLETIPEDNSITFRGHAKGVKYDDPEATREWSEMLYETCLDDPQHVEACLEQYPVCGPFVVESDWPSPGRWHFSGAFFWFRSRELARLDVKQISENYWGVELWPQSIWERHDAGVLFGQNCGRLYNGNELSRMKGWLEEFRATRRQKVTSPTIPVYVNARNLVTPLRKLVNDLLKIEHARPIIIDNDSTWMPLLDYYDKDCPVEVIRTGTNGGKFGWKDHMLNHVAEGIGYYVVTDADLEISGIPVDVLTVLQAGLDNNPSISKVGLSLDFEQVPDDYPLKEEVVAHESQFWRHRSGGFCHAGIDTTFAMRRASDSVAFETHGHLRADRPYCAKHWPWTWTPEVIADSEEIKHYIRTARAEGLHWTARHVSQNTTTSTVVAAVPH